MKDPNPVSEIIIPIDKLKKLLVDSINDLYQHDFHLIEHNLSERSIAHMLAVHLRTNFSKYNLNVDCEYNGDVENKESKERKTLDILMSELIKIKHPKTLAYLNEQFIVTGRTSEDFGDNDIQRLSVFPDIIVHKRGENKTNSLVIEIKKNYKKRSIGDAFDKRKLATYTGGWHENHLKYKLGAYIEFDTLMKRKSYRIEYFEHGEVHGEKKTVNESIDN